MMFIKTKKIKWICFFLFTLTAFANYAENAFPGASDTLDALSSTAGDLDKDDVEEKAVVYNTSREGDLGTEREIHIYKKVNNKWTLWHKSIGAVLPSQGGGMMGDPFQGVEIERGALVFYHFGGSREKWHYIHRYRYQEGDWFLIGASINFGAACDHQTDFDYNLATGNAEYKKKIERCDDKTDKAGGKAISKKFSKNLKSLPKMDGFRPGENEFEIPDSDITIYY